MTSLIRVTGATAAAAILMLPARADAQVSCGDLPNVVVVGGTPAFDSIISGFVLAATSATPSTTFAYPGYSSPLMSSRAAVESLPAGKDLGGTPGRYYRVTGNSLPSSDCVFAAGQTLDLALSEVFYETCANAPQPKPAEVIDAPGPVQPAMLVVPKANTT